MKKLLGLALISLVVAGCQAPGQLAGSAATGASAVLAKVTQPQEKINAYFDSEWRLSAKPVANGYFRKLYGKTADGHYIAQDFYQENGAKQTDPFEIINEAGLTNGENDQNTGTITWYDKQGTRTKVETFVNGKSTGAVEEYHANGRIKSKVEPLGNGGNRGTVYYESGTKMGVVITARDASRHVRSVQIQAWHANGTQAVDFSGRMPAGKDTQIKGWSADGKALSDTEAALQAMQFGEKLHAVLPEDL